MSRAQGDHAMKQTYPADMATDVYALRTMIADAARKADRGEGTVA